MCLPAVAWELSKMAASANFGQACNQTIACAAPLQCQDGSCTCPVDSAEWRDCPDGADNKGSRCVGFAKDKTTSIFTLPRYQWGGSMKLGDSVTKESFAACADVCTQAGVYDGGSKSCRCTDAPDAATACISAKDAPAGSVLFSRAAPPTSLPVCP
jgi:hypothetical protein